MRDLLSNPLTWLSALAGGALQYMELLHLDILLDLGVVVWGQAGALFSAFSIAGFTLAPNLEWVPTGAVETAALLLGAVFVLKKLSGVMDGARDRFNGGGG